MNRFRLPSLALVCSFPFLLCAQSAFTAPIDEVPPPQPPFVATPQPATQWAVLVKYSATSVASPSRHALQIKYQNTAEITVVSAEWSDGTKNEGYVKGRQVIFLDPKQDSCYVAPAQDTDPFSPIFVIGYLGTAWITKDDYQGTEVIDGEPCYRFFRDVQGGNTELPIPAHTAWVRVRDKKPVRVKIGDALFLYSPIVEAPASVTLPPKVRAFMGVIDAQQKALDLLRQLNQKQ